MSFKNYSTENVVVTVNGRVINDWGEDNPVREAMIDPHGTLMRGLGGRAARLDRINPGRLVELNIMPGSPDAAYLQGLLMSRANITYTRTVISTMENAVGSEGMFVEDGEINRGGMTISDDSFTMHFNKFETLKGGD